MKIAITGGSGFVGRHLAQRLAAEGHELVLLARGVDRRDGTLAGHPRVTVVATDLGNPVVLEKAFAGCEAVAHCAGINRELGPQTYQKVHVEGTAHVVEAAQKASVQRIVLMSFLRARPHCGSPYHESKWAAEEIVRSSGLDYTVIKAGVTYGRGDHLLDHLSHSLFTLSVFASVGFKEKPVRPLAVEDLVQVLHAALVDGDLKRQTVAVTGPEALYLSEVVQRVGWAIGKKVLVIPAPLWAQYLLAQVFEWTMKVPLVAKAQVRILSEGVTEAATPCSPLLAYLEPTLCFTQEQIQKGLPNPGPFGWHDLRCCV